MFDVNVGSIVKIHESKKDGSSISYTDLGKVILFKNKNELYRGFAEITSVEEREKYILATAKNVPYDFYNGTMTKDAISYEEFSEVLTSLGFRHQYTTPIDDKNNFYVWANLDTGVLITIEEYNRNGIHNYNSVNVYVVGRLNLNYRECNADGVIMQDGSFTVFNLCFSKFDFPLRQVLKYAASKDWNGRTPDLWHYKDIKDVSPREFKAAMMRVFEFKDDVNALFNMRAEEHIKSLEEWGSSDHF